MSQTVPQTKLFPPRCPLEPFEILPPSWLIPINQWDLVAFSISLRTIGAFLPLVLVFYVWHLLHQLNWLYLARHQYRRLLLLPLILIDFTILNVQVSVPWVSTVHQFLHHIHAYEQSLLLSTCVSHSCGRPCPSPGRSQSPKRPSQVPPHPRST